MHVDFILHVTGYYENAPTGLPYYPLTPGRIMENSASIV